MLENKNQTWLTLGEASKLASKSAITLRRWIKELKKNDYSNFEVCIGKKGKENRFVYLISQSCLIKKFDLPTQKEKVPTQKEGLPNQKTALPTQEQEQKQGLTTQNEGLLTQLFKDFKKRFGREKAVWIAKEKGFAVKEKSFESELRDLEIKNAKLETSNEHLGQNLKNRERYILERDEKFERGLVQMGMLKGENDSLKNQIKLLIAPKKKRWWQKK